MLAADGVFRADGAFVRLPVIPAKLLELGFRSQVLKLLIAEGTLAESLAARMLTWRHSGFSVHNAVRVRADDAAGRIKLAQYMLRAPLSLEKMTYDARSGMVIYRSCMHKGLKRNFQLMPGAQWLEMLCRHIPERFEHLVRYVGWYSTRCRGERARSAVPPNVDQAPEDAQAVAARARSAWARLIHKVHEVDPLVCARCDGLMKVIALIDDAQVMERILTHLGIWAPRQSAPQYERPPPRGGPQTDATERAPDVLTCQPVPDIA